MSARNGFSAASISQTYDSLNRLTGMVDAVGSSSYGYDGIGQLTAEDGPWANDTVSYAYTARMRTSLSLQQPDSGPWVQTYGYDGARRLTNTTSPAGSFGYAYDPAAQTQVDTLALPNGARITNGYDGNARQLTTKLLNGGGTILDSQTYTYNQGNQRTEVIRTYGDFVNYSYDPIGQLVGANAKEFGGVTNRLQEQLSYAYDKAHNLVERDYGSPIPWQTFGVNSLNELTNFTRSLKVQVSGTTGASATSVHLPGSWTATNAVLYNDATWASATALSAPSGYNTFTAIAADALGRHSTNSVTAYLPLTNSGYVYDLNGNLLSDGKRVMAYDDENELVSVYVTNVFKTEFMYDGKLRMRIRREYTWQSAWVQTNEVHYVYDGNLPVQERDLNNLPVNSYTRGRDMSGSMQGAGGIGGMLAMSVGAASPQHYYYHADGNGNNTAMINASQAVAAKYLYDPYGNLLSQSGPMAAINHYRFSSKETLDNSGLVYYLRRFYDPNLQRWPNRDPIEDIGWAQLLSASLPVAYSIYDANSYLACKNDFLDNRDNWGLFDQTDVIKCQQRCDAFCSGPGIPNPVECAKNCYARCDDDPSKPPSPLPPPPPLPPTMPKDDLWPLCKSIVKNLWHLWKDRKDIKHLPDH